MYCERRRALALAAGDEPGLASGDERSGMCEYVVGDPKLDLEGVAGVMKIEVCIVVDVESKVWLSVGKRRGLRPVRRRRMLC